MSKKALLVISFGTTYQDTRDKTIGAIEQHLAQEFSSYDLYRAFTSRVVINKLKNRDGVIIDTPTEALEKLYELKYDEVICQTTHVLSGYEFEKTVAEIEKFKDKFKSIQIGLPLLSSPQDYYLAVDAIVKNAQ